MPITSRTNIKNVQHRPRTINTLKEELIRNIWANFDLFLISNFKKRRYVSKLLTTDDGRQWTTDTALSQKLTLALCSRWDRNAFNKLSHYWLKVMQTAPDRVFCQQPHVWKELFLMVALYRFDSKSRHSFQHYCLLAIKQPGLKELLFDVRSIQVWL